jgi:hypothetical protein
MERYPAALKSANIDVTDLAVIPASFAKLSMVSELFREIRIKIWAWWLKKVHGFVMAIPPAVGIASPLQEIYYQKYISAITDRATTPRG